MTAASLLLDPARRRERRRRLPPLVERRFPLHLEPHIVTIRELYHAAKKAKWDPEKHIPWAAFRPGDYKPAVRRAAALSWSRRAWTEYTGMPETPAILIRFCLEHAGESDPKMFFAVRGTEEAWHTECCYRFAELLGGYLPSPADPRYRELFNQDFHREAFDPGLAVDAYVAAYCAVMDGIDLELHRGYLRHAVDPVAREILTRLTRDKERHVQFGWIYLRQRAPHWSAELAKEIAAEIDQALEGLEFNGYHCAWLVPDGAAAEVIEADRTTRRAGLGAMLPEEEAAILRRFLEEAREHLDQLGLVVGDWAPRVPFA